MNGLESTGADWFFDSFTSHNTANVDAADSILDLGVGNRFIVSDGGDDEDEDKDEED